MNILKVKNLIVSTFDRRSVFTQPFQQNRTELSVQTVWTSVGASVCHELSPETNGWT